MTDVRKPHDRFIKDLLSDRETVKDFLSNYLPAELRDAVDLNQISAVKDTFIDQKLREYFSDMLYYVSLAQSKGYVYILFEHKSYDEPLAIIQMLEYQSKIWRFFYKQHGKELFPVIIPILVYHGEKPWKHGTRLSELLHIPSSALVPYIPDFSFILCDLTSMHDAEIKGSFLLKLSFLLMKYIKHPDFTDQFRRIFKSFKDEGIKTLDEQHWLIILEYILNATDKIKLEELQSVFEETVSSETGGNVMSLAEQLVKKGELERSRADIAKVITFRFNRISPRIKLSLEEITDERKLDKLLKSAVTVEKYDEFIALLEGESQKTKRVKRASKKAPSENADQ